MNRLVVSSGPSGGKEISDVSEVLLAADQRRAWLQIDNGSEVDADEVWVCFGEEAVAGEGIRIPPGGSWTMSGATGIYCGRVSIVASAGTPWISWQVGRGL